MLVLGFLYHSPPFLPLEQLRYFQRSDSEYVAEYLLFFFQQAVTFPGCLRCLHSAQMFESRGEKAFVP